MTNKIQLDLSVLSHALARMGARPTVVDLGRKLPPLPAAPEVARALVEGVTVDSSEIDVTAGGLLAYQGYQVVLYIPDQGSDIDAVLRNGSEGKRVHVADCRTLRQMREAGRYQRYVARNGFSPDFRVSGTRRRSFGRGQQKVENAEARLQVCFNCLEALNYEGFQHASGSARHKLIRKFSLQRFFDRYYSYFDALPDDHESKYHANVYPENWTAVSKQVRTAAGWRCTNCRVDLSSDPQLLHVHHRDGNKRNISDSNLVTLCEDCHAKEPFHGHMFVPYRHRARIQALRRAQGLLPQAGGTHGQAWEEVIQRADPALKDLLDALRRRRSKAPECGYPIESMSGRIVHADLAWPKTKRAVFIREPGERERQALRKRGWSVEAPWELLGRE